ncbi:MAG: GtrA family protein [Patescibacteria group bacterium]|nr:GtrA family protein [Patescibacteria group bacterium]MDD4610450.1 GtrA family protein [Patescibacteria group bacterium]
MRKIYQKLKNKFNTSYPNLYEKLDKKKIIIKYIISGGIATTVDLGLLYFFTDIFKIWYLASATFAFVIAFFVSFSLQKFWTFRENSREKIIQQLSLYLITGLINLGINAAGMYILVDILNLWYILAQIIMGGVVAIGSFLVYKFVIFNPIFSKRYENNC